MPVVNNNQMRPTLDQGRLYLHWSIHAPTEREKQIPTITSTSLQQPAVFFGMYQSKLDHRPHASVPPTLFCSMSCAVPSSSKYEACYKWSLE